MRGGVLCRGMLLGRGDEGGVCDQESLLCRSCELPGRLAWVALAKWRAGR